MLAVCMLLALQQLRSLRKAGSQDQFQGRLGNRKLPHS